MRTIVSCRDSLHRLDCFYYIVIRYTYQIPQNAVPGLPPCNCVPHAESPNSAGTMLNQPSLASFATLHLESSVHFPPLEANCDPALYPRRDGPHLERREPLSNLAGR